MYKRQFQCHNTTEQLTENQLNQLIGIYEKYRPVFSDEPGKIRNYQLDPIQRTGEIQSKTIPHSTIFEGSCTHRDPEYD